MPSKKWETQNKSTLDYIPLIEYNTNRILEETVMLKHGILGLLNYREMSGYEIMTVFRDSLNFFWNAQTSQIYRELQNLKEYGWVTDTTIPQHGKPDKNVFSVTETGKSELKRWLSDNSIKPGKNPLLMRTFFRGELPPEENIQFFQSVKEYAINCLKEMEKPPVSADLYSKEIDDPVQAVYWGMTIEYGIMYMNMLRQWSEMCIGKLEKLPGNYPDNE